MNPNQMPRNSQRDEDAFPEPTHRLYTVTMMEEGRNRCYNIVAKNATTAVMEADDCYEGEVYLVQFKEYVHNVRG